MPAWLDAIVFFLTIFFMLVGLFGSLIPLFPGLVIIWLAALIYGIVVGFKTLGIVIFILITLLMLVGGVVDNIMMGVGARLGKAGWWSIIIALISGIVVTLVFPPFGGLIAAPLAVYLAEVIRQRDWRKAFKSLGGLTAGWSLSFLVRFGIGVVMIVLWGIWAWLR